MMLFTLDLVAKTFSEYNQNASVLTNEIHEISTDSRKQTNKGLYIPIVGDRFNGHDFLLEAIENGAVAAIWDKKYDIPTEISATFPIFFVTDTTMALQKLASVYLQFVQPKVIGITGSNGKTTTKDLVYSLVKQKYRTHRTIGNFNNHIGLPLTILQMSPHTEVIILEMGMDSYGEIERLAQITHPDIAIITNIGESHMENFGNREGIAKAKLEIISQFTKNDLLIVDGDEPLLHNVKVPTIRCGFQSNNDLTISNVTMDERSTSFMLQSEEQYTIPLIGSHHALNATYAIAVAKQLQITNEEIIKGFTEVDRTSMRFEFVEGKDGTQLINDAYNASPTSMKAAIKVLKQLPNTPEKIVVLGDILELGENSETFHRSIAEVISKPINFVYTYGEQAHFITKQLEENASSVQFQHFSTKTELAKALQSHLQQGTMILFKASRGMAFETLVQACM